MNLPADLTSFVGRDRELALVDTMLAEARLVTLTGTGGSGKTRLAARAGALATGRYSDGVWWVDLATEADPDGVPARVASALAITRASQAFTDQSLSERLVNSNALLILDNCEHLIDRCAEMVATVLQRCPMVSFLCTSQEPLSISGESVVRVPPLQLAAEHAGVSATDAIKSEAVRLFVDRCRLVDPEFVLTDAFAPAIAKICRRLDGLPLAIELAAARLPLFTLAEMEERLEDRFRLLVGRSRTAMSRHHTLRAAVAWSYDLLSQAERSLFDRLSVFAGGFTVDAVEMICTIDHLDPSRSVELLERLYLRSMLVKLGGAPARYRLLETLRQYGEEQLATRPDEANALRGRHCGYYLDLAIYVGPTLKSPKARDGARRLGADVDNLRAALAWAVERHPLAALQAVNGLLDFWIDRTELAEGLRWTSAALETDVEMPSADRDEALLSMARLNWARGDVGGTRTYATDALNRARAANRRQHIADALIALSGTALLDGQPEVADPMLGEALSIRLELEDRSGIAAILNNLALVEEQRGHLDEARRLAHEALDLGREVANPRLLASIHESLGRILVSQGSFAEAHEIFVDGLQLAVETSPAMVAIILEDIAGIFVASGSHKEALVLASAAESLRFDPGVGLAQAWRERNSRSLAVAQSSVTPDEARLARATGKQLKVEDAVQLAMRPPIGKAAAPTVTVLTPREAEVSRLLMVGFSDKEIARDLGIAQRTVQAHIDHIKTKLDVQSRAQIAVWFVENGLRA